MWFLYDVLEPESIGYRKEENTENDQVVTYVWENSAQHLNKHSEILENPQVFYGTDPRKENQARESSAQLTFLCLTQLLVILKDKHLPEIRQREHNSNVVAIIPHLHLMPIILDLHTLQNNLNHIPPQNKPLILAKHDAQEVQAVVEELSVAEHL